MISRKFFEGIHYLRNHFSRASAIFGLSLMVLSLFPVGVSAVLQDSVVVVTFSPGESLESKLKKAAHVRPSPAQIKWMERERNAFMHYGMNTFHGDDWGTGKENPKDFTPMQQNPEQWAKVHKDAKISMTVPTAKHHDGFCIWNTATTDQSVKNATVTTDVIDALHKGCEKYGVDLGIYLSPWDMNQNEKGVWRTDAYNTVFINQLKELLGGQYGPIGELWFDGACGWEPTFKNLSWYRTKDWYDTIEALQPMAVIRPYDGFYFSGTEKDSSEWVGIKQGTQKLKWRGKEIRWCGNEGGAGRADEWCVQPVWTRFFGSELQNGSLGQESFYSNAVGAVWYQSEVNTSIGEHWFWHSPGSQGYALKSLSSLKTLYYNSIGNDACLLLNLIVDNRGLIPEDQITLLKNWTNWIDSTFTKNLANGAAAEASSQAPGHEADKIIDNKRHTYWTPGGAWNLGTGTASVTFTLPSAQTFDNVMIKEYVYDGQRVAGWNLEYQDNTGAWKSLITGKKVIGYKRISKFTQVTSSKVRLNITRSWDTPEISNFALYRTLSGIDLTSEDTSRDVAVAPAAKQSRAPVAADSKLHPIFKSGRLLVPVSGEGRFWIEVTGLNGERVVNKYGNAVQNGIVDCGQIPLSTGVYIIKVHGSGSCAVWRIPVTRQ